MTEYRQSFRRFAELFGIRRERARIPQIAKAACQEGFAVVAVAAGDKNPICTLTQVAKKKADKEAQDVAKAAGKTKWEYASHACGRAHAITDPAEALRVFTRLLKQGPVNIGLEPGKSRWITVDADQAEDVQAWASHWAERSNDPSLSGGAPTVSSPGKLDDGGTWRHKGGGHIHYWLPSGVDFSDSEVRRPMPSVAGCQVYFNDGLILLPPSVRPEGEYILQSDACQAPDWLVDEVIGFIEGQHEKANEQHTDYEGNSPIDRWALEQNFDDLLSGDGWRFSHKVDRCACPIWTRPGEDRGSYKSATAHEAGCLRFETDDTPGFLHLWTDNPPGFLRDYIAATGRKSISKFNYVAWRDHAGDTKEAFRALGLGDGSDKEAEDYAEFIAGLKHASTSVHLTRPPLNSGGGGRVTQNPSSEPCQNPVHHDENQDSVSIEEPRDAPPAEAVVAQLGSDEDLAGPHLAALSEPFRPLVSKELGIRWARREAQRIDNEIQLQKAEQDEGSLDVTVKMTTAFNAEYDDEEYTVEGLLLQAGKALFTAPAKAGKTTTVASLIYALTRGKPFLDQFTVQAPQRVYVIDTEMTPRKHVEWMKSVDIDPGMADVAYMRGQAQRVDLRTEAAQVRWARVLKSNGAQVLVIDPLSPILAGLGLDENAAGDVQAFLAGVDSLITRAELTGAVVVHHHGHSGERGRGSSAFLGWPDAIWTLVKDDDDVRYFAALGRDIEVPESALAFDPDTRRLSIPDVGARRQTKNDAKKEARDSDVVNYLRGNQPQSGRQIAEGMEVAYSTVSRALERLELAQKIHSASGPKNSKLWRLA